MGTVNAGVYPSGSPRGSAHARFVSSQGRRRSPIRGKLAKIVYIYIYTHREKSVDAKEA